MDETIKETTENLDVTEVTEEKSLKNILNQSPTSLLF